MCVYATNLVDTPVKSVKLSFDTAMAISAYLQKSACIMLALSARHAVLRTHRMSTYLHSTCSALRTQID